jgi:DNA-directed RNA polymerase specialized sigma subunit
VEFLKQPFTPIVPIEPKPEKEKKVLKNRKRFSREDAMKLLKSGSSYVEIGNVYGVSRVAVWKALQDNLSGKM